MAQYEPGLVMDDPDGVWSHGVPVLYLLLSRDREADGHRYWRVACFQRVDNGFCGAFDRPFADGELDRMRVVGRLQPECLTAEQSGAVWSAPPLDLSGG